MFPSVSPVTPNPLTAPGSSFSPSSDDYYEQGGQTATAPVSSPGHTFLTRAEALGRRLNRPQRGGHIRSEIKRERPQRPVRTFRGSHAAPGTHRSIHGVPAQWLESASTVASKAMDLARNYPKPLAAVGAVAFAATVTVAATAGEDPSHAAAQDALSPLRDTVEMMSRNEVSDAASRSAELRAGAAVQVENLAAPTVSNAAIALDWQPVGMAPTDVLVIRRAVGDVPPATITEGVEVPVDAGANQTVDQGLLPETTYSYTLFLQRGDRKPEVIGQLVASTQLHPTVMAPGDSLVAGERLVSPTGAAWVGLTDAGTLVAHDAGDKDLWTLAAPASPGATLVMSTTGELTLQTPAETVWATGVPAEGASARLTDDGELQIMSGEAVIWSSALRGVTLSGGDSSFQIAKSGWTVPGAGPINSPFGYRIHPIYGGTKMHEGVDLKAGGRGGPIWAAHAGVVTDWKRDSGGNWTLIIDHGEGVTTRYLHMESDGALVRVGEKVAAGQLIARTGSSGNSTGPHLHFEVRLKEEPVDPVAFMAARGVKLG